MVQFQPLKVAGIRTSCRNSRVLYVLDSNRSVVLYRTVAIEPDAIVITIVILALLLWSLIKIMLLYTIKTSNGLIKNWTLNASQAKWLTTVKKNRFGKPTCPVSRATLKEFKVTPAGYQLLSLSQKYDIIGRELAYDWLMSLGEDWVVKRRPVRNSEFFNKIERRYPTVIVEWKLLD